MDVESPTPPVLPLAAGWGARLRWILVALAALGLGALAWLIFRAADEDKRSERWDQYGELRRRNEGEEMFFSGSEPLYQMMRDDYVRKLEEFLKAIEEQAAQDALAPQVRWRVVKTEGESLISMRDVLDVAKRIPHADRAIRHLEAIQEKYPDFPLNWGGSFAPPNFANQTRRLLQWFRDNKAWEQEWLPKDTPAETGVTVVLRTERGDLRLGLYTKDAPAATARFLAHVQAGRYDGTAFVARVDQSAGGETTVAAVRGGDPRATDVKPYDRQDHLRFASDAGLEGMLPDESRNRILHVRGVLTTWHGDETYDDPQQLLLVVRDSPGLNYRHTPIGRLLDAASLATLDRLYAAKPWRDDPVVAADTGSLAALKDLFQAPAKIVKALAYGQDGALLTGTVPAAPTKAAADESEKTLAGLKPDAYQVKPPDPPAPPVAPTAPAAPAGETPPPK